MPLAPGVCRWRSDLIGRDVQELGQPADPLLKQRATVHEHERRSGALGDERGRHHGLAGAGRRHEDPGLVRCHRFDGRLLRRCQGPCERRRDRSPSLRSSRTVRPAQLLRSRRRRASKQPRGSSRRSPVSSWQAITRGVLCVDSRARSRSKNSGLANAAVRRRRSRRSGASPATGNLDPPVNAISIALDVQRQLTRTHAGLRVGAPGQAERPAGAFRFGRDLLGLLAVQSLNAGEIDPLIRDRLEILAEEHRAAFGATSVLQRQRDQIAEPAGGHRVLVGEQPVIGGHRDRTATHRARQQQRADRARNAGGHRSREQDPQVRAVTRAGTLDEHRNVQIARRCHAARRRPRASPGRQGRSRPASTSRRPAAGRSRPSGALRGGGGPPPSDRDEAPVARSRRT